MLYRGSLNRSSTVIKITKQLVRLFCGLYTKEQELALSRLGHGLLCRRVRVRFPNVTPNPSFNFFPFLVALSGFKKPLNGALMESRAQLFEGRLALIEGQILTWVSFSFVQKHFPGEFSLPFLEHPMINCRQKEYN